MNTLKTSRGLTCLAFCFTILVLLMCFFGCQASIKQKEDGNASQDISALESQARENFKNNELQKAYTLYNKLLKIDSSKEEYLLNQGFCAGMLGHASESDRLLFRAVNLNQNKAKAFYYLGLFQVNVNNALAKEYFKKCLIENPNHKKAADFYLAIQGEEISIQKALSAGSKTK